MEVKLNKGEWAEPYVALKLLGDGKLYMGDHRGKIRSDAWVNIQELIRYETKVKCVVYERDSETSTVDILVNEEHYTQMPADKFSVAASRLFKDINTGSGAFAVSEEVMDFFKKVLMKRLKAQSVQKCDIFLTTHDPRIGVVRRRVGFSIKSKVGHDPSLFNTASSSAVRYWLEGATKEDLKIINNLFDSKGHAATSDRCKAILNRGLIPRYDGYAIGKRAGYEVFKDNLDVIDPRLPLLIEQLLYNHFFRGFEERDIPAVVDRVINENPLKLERPEVKYPYMFKSFLYASYCGLTASTPWNGEGEVNGGFISVDGDGNILAQYALESEDFKSYLYENCYLEYPATSERHGDYAKVYEKDGKYYFHLNFSIRIH